MNDYMKLNKKNILIVILCAVLCLPGTAACGRNSGEAWQGAYIYYVTKGNDGIVPQEYLLTAEETEGQIEELLRALAEDPMSVEYRPPLGDGIRVYCDNDFA